ncbi:MAG: hypothetical protein ACYS5V_13175 [Planctomycetota bacterium]|jgi:hypothetical protein
MAQFDNRAYIGPHNVAPSDAQLDTIGRYDKAHGSAGREGHARRPASFDSLAVPIQAQIPSGGNAQSIAVAMPWPAKIVAIDAGREVDGGSLSALTVDVQLDDGGGYASILDGGTPVDIFAAGPLEYQRFATEDGKEDVAYGDKVQVTFAATGDVADGANVILWVKRL